VFATAWQGWGDDNNTPPALRAARAGEMLATTITAISTATIKTLIIRFIDQPPCSTDLSAFYVLTITDPSCQRHRTNEQFLQFFWQPPDRSFRRD